MADDDEGPKEGVCSVCRTVKAKNFCQNCATRYGGVSMHLDNFTRSLGGALKTIYGGTRMLPPRPVTAAGPIAATSTKMEVQKVPRASPTVLDFVKEDEQIPDRSWDYDQQSQVAVPWTKEAKRAVQPPWGELTLPDITRTRVPMSMVGSGHVYFNAATYKKERLTGMLSLMDLQNLPREQFVYFMHRSTEPLKDGYLTMWRIVSRTAYEEYYRSKMSGDQNPDKKRAKKALFEHLDKCCKEEIKKWGKGIPAKQLHFDEDKAQNGEEEPEEAEEDEEAANSKGASNDSLNEIMQLNVDGKTRAEWGLGFGFLVESDVYRVYRLWSRPILHSIPPAPPLQITPASW